jgi:mercuric ion binding protein
MKTYKSFSLVIICLASTMVSFSQGAARTESVPVSGNCGMCKAKIEKAAKDAGASSAVWSEKTKTLIIKYNSSTTNTAKIEQSVADAGYDTRDVKATNEAYHKLSACCQYDRAGNDNSKNDDSKMDCCKDGKCSKEGHNGKDCCKKS